MVRFGLVNKCSSVRTWGSVAALGLSVLLCCAGCNRGPGKAAKAMLHLHKGNQLLEQNQVPEAAAEFAKAVELHPDNNLARLKLAETLMTLGRYPQAIEQLKTIVQADPLDRSARATLARAFERVGLAEEAIMHYENLIFAEPGAWELKLNLGQLYRGIGRYVAAQREFAQLIRERPRLTQAYNSMGNLYTSIRSTMEALECFERAVAVGPDNFMALYNLGLTHMNLGWSDTAEVYFNKTLELTPDFPYSHLQLGLIAEGRKQDEEAERHFRIAAMDIGTAPFALTRLAMRMIARGDLKEAQRPLETATRLNQGDVYPWEDTALYLLADLHLRQKKDAEALTCLKGAVERNPGAYRAMHKLADLYKAKGDPAKAKELQTKAEETEKAVKASKKAFGHFSKALRHYRQKKLDQARAEAEASMAAQENLDAMLLLARMDFEAGQTPAAQKRLATVCAMEPLSEMANTYRGRALVNEGKHEEAFKVLYDSSRARPYDIPLNLALGQAALKLNKPKDALTAYQMALAIDYKDQAAIKGLQAVYAALGKAEPAKLVAQDVEVEKRKAAAAAEDLARRLKEAAERRVREQAARKAQAAAQAVAATPTAAPATPQGSGAKPAAPAAGPKPKAPAKPAPK